MSTISEIAPIFTDAQLSTSSHRKNSYKLYSLHKESTTPQEEELFFLEFLKNLNICLSIKRNEELSTRMIKFIGSFLSISLEKYTKSNEMASHSRLIENLMRYLLNGAESKDKTVRSRCCNLLTLSLDAAVEMSEDIYNLFKIKMSERLFDKEWTVRSAAVLALSRFQNSFVDENNSISVSDLFIDLIQHDSHFEVRKTVLNAMDVNEITLSFIVARCQDVDAQVRKVLYSKKLPLIELTDFSVSQRDFLLKTGLLDRDPTVKQACLELIYNNWILKSNSNLIQFLTFLNVLVETKAVEEALMGFFEIVPNMFTTFTSDFFSNLTKETAITLRVFSQFVFTKRGLEECQELLPQPIIFAKHLKECIEKVESFKENETEFTESLFILNEMLKMGELLDLSDEAGRRDLTFILSEYLLDLSISEKQISAGVRFLKIISQTESEFTQTISDIINELRELFDSDNVLDVLQENIEKMAILSSSPDIPEGVQDKEELNVKILANLKCLEIVKNVLSLTDSTNMATNPLLAGCLNELVIPALNNPFVIIQNEGLLCLGLLSVMDKSVAKDYSQIFLQFYRNSDVTEVKVSALGTLFDLTCLYGLEFTESLKAVTEESDSIFSDFKKALFDSQYEIQTLAVEGLSKLFFLKLLTDWKVLEGLIFLYFHPTSADNARLRQTVGFFLNSFALNSFDNQLLISKCVIALIEAFLALFSENCEKTIQFTQQLFYWTDSDNIITVKGKQTFPSIHSQIALDLLLLILKHSDTENLKLLSSLLSKLKIISSDQIQVKRLTFTASHILKVIASDKTASNFIKKFISHLLECDDGTVDQLSAEDLSDLKQKIKSSLLE